MSKYTEALNEITKYQVELEYTMQGTDKWRNAIWTCKEALEIADRAGKVVPPKSIGRSTAFDHGFVCGWYECAETIKRGDNNG